MTERSRYISPLELQILEALADGLPSKEIATRLHRSKPTIEGYVRLLCLKFEARSRTHLVARAFVTGTLNVAAANEEHELSLFG